METLKSLADKVGPRTDRTDRAPSFDVARIEPSGDAVIAGHAAPGATVELLRGGVTHDRTVADSRGEFVLVPKPLPPGSYDLTLRATKQDGKVSTSKDSVAVELRASGKDKPVVALAAPDKPVVVLSKPAADAGAMIELAIDAVEGEAGGRMYVSGRAPPGARVNLYLNDAYIATATASANGRIAISIRSGIRPGDYRVRLDQVDASGRVQKRVEVPFKAPAMLAAPAPPDTRPPRSDDTADARASAGSDRAAAAPPAAAGGTEPTPSKSAPRIASAAGPANPKPAAASTTPAPSDNASAPAERPAPPSPATSRPVASQQPAPSDNASASAEPPAPPSPATSRPVAAQQPAPRDATPPPVSMPPPSNEKKAASTDVVVVPHVETTVVTRGDSLWRISKTTYGHGIRYSVIYKANRDQIRNPDLIYPGQIFVLPKDRP